MIAKWMERPGLVTHNISVALYLESEKRCKTQSLRRTDVGAGVRSGVGILVGVVGVGVGIVVRHELVDCEGRSGGGVAKLHMEVTP